MIENVLSKTYVLVTNAEYTKVKHFLLTYL